MSLKTAPSGFAIPPKAAGYPRKCSYCSSKVSLVCLRRLCKQSAKWNVSLPVVCVWIDRVSQPGTFAHIIGHMAGQDFHRMLKTKARNGWLCSIDIYSIRVWNLIQANISARYQQSEGQHNWVNPCSCKSEMLIFINIFTPFMIEKKMKSRILNSFSDWILRCEWVRASFEGRSLDERGRIIRVQVNRFTLPQTLFIPYRWPNMIWNYSSNFTSDTVLSLNFSQKARKVGRSRRNGERLAWHSEYKTRSVVVKIHCSFPICL